MLRYLLIALLMLPFIDFYLLIQVADTIGLLETILFSIFTGIIGAELIRREGRHVFQKLSRSVTGGEVTRNFLEAFMLAASGLLLLTPGFVTDFLGALIVFRPVRERIVARLTNSFSGSIEVEFQPLR